MGASVESRAGFGLRFVASLIDGVLISIGGTVIGTVLGGVIGGIAGGMLGTVSPELGSQEGVAIGGMLGSLIGIIVGTILLSIVYNLLEVLTGATFGKMIIGLKVGAADGVKAPLGKLFFRYIIKNIAYVTAVLAGGLGIALLSKIGGILGLIVFLGYFLALGNSRQALHDLIAGTAVYPNKVLH